MFVDDIRPLTLKVMTVAGALFLLSELLIRLMSLKKVRITIGGVDLRQTDDNSGIGDFEVSTNMMRVLVWIGFGAIIFALSNLYLSQTSGSFMERIQQYVKLTHYHQEMVFAPNMIYQVIRVLQNIIYILAYYFVYKVYKNKSYRSSKQFKYFVVFSAEFIIFTLLTGQREPSVRYIIILVLYRLLLMTCYNNKGSVDFKFIMRVIALGIIFIFGFYFVAQFVGRTNQNLADSALGYVTLYASSGLYAFNIRITNPASSLYFGQKTLSGYYIWLNKMGVVPSSVIEKRWDDFERYGNTYTLFGHWYEDFGAKGVYICVIIVAVVFAIMFYKIYNDAGMGYEDSLLRIVYIRFLSMLLFAGYDDHVSKLIAPQTIIDLIMTWFFFKLIFNHFIVFKYQKYRV